MEEAKEFDILNEKELKFFKEIDNMTKIYEDNAA